MQVNRPYLPGLVTMSDARQSEPAPFPRVSYDLPAVTASQMAQVDDLAVGEYGIDLLQMMENAGGGGIAARDARLSCHW